MSLSEKIKTSIERIRGFEDIALKHKSDTGESGYYLAFSGGKDSLVVKTLMDMAGVYYESFYQVSTVDPPELVQYIKKYHPDVTFKHTRYHDGSRVTMWNLIPRKMMPPTRRFRYCCEYLKESGGDGRFTVTGVRWAESVNRSRKQGLVTLMGKSAVDEYTDNSDFRATPNGTGVVLVNDNTESRQMLDGCVSRHKTVFNPIIDWEYRDVWEFIRGERLPYCELYDCGFHRVGCIGCPMGGRKHQLWEFAQYPKYKNGYLMAFQKMIDARIEKGLKMPDHYKDPETVFNWWVEDPNIEGQMNLWEDDG